MKEEILRYFPKSYFREMGDCTNIIIWDEKGTSEFYIFSNGDISVTSLKCGDIEERRMQLLLVNLWAEEIKLNEKKRSR